MWRLPSGTLGWREAKAEEAKRKARKSDEMRGNAIFFQFKTEAKKWREMWKGLVCLLLWGGSRARYGSEVDRERFGWFYTGLGVEREKGDG